MNEQVQQFVQQRMAQGMNLNQAVNEAKSEFGLSATLVYLSIIQAERRQLQYV
ncbi:MULTISPECIES: hypothetical protein [Chitinibacter]|jgi:hypothetical protein|uniref:hypothetical protein n=1 Tax=Chitinibacter TaxID=230666 RepID=UPI000403E4AA|nr:MULTISPECIES: hypothetical protein [Chitinibacter]